jgi:hypothetical protein
MFNSKGTNKNIFNVNYYWALSLKNPLILSFLFSIDLNAYISNICITALQIMHS